MNYKRIISSVIAVISCLSLWAQTPEVVQRVVQRSALNLLWVETGVPERADQPFIGCVVKLKNTWPSHLSYSIFAKGQWSNFITVLRDSHIDQWQTEMFFLPKEAKKLRIRCNSSSIRIAFIYPGNSKVLVPMSIRNEDYCDQPTMFRRNEWCPDGNCPEDATPEYTDATHLIVHHSAGTNTSNDWPAVVRAIWALHVNVNGWDDIGYNWLVDPRGMLYEGRGHDRLGAHFCHTNSNTAGICALGNFQSVEPTDSTLTHLSRLMTWVCYENLIDPLGFSLHSSSGLDLAHISGHRDGCSTACPGDMLFPKLSGVRSNVDSLLAFCEITGIAPVGPQEALLLMPNPAHDRLTIKNNTSGKPEFIHIFDAAGVLVYSSDQVTNLHQVDIKHLRPGVYYVSTPQQTESFVKL